MALRQPPIRTQPKPFGREHDPESWERQRKNIERLYLENNVHLDDLPAAMKRDFGFEANRRQYITRIRKWGLHKNLKDSELRIIYRKLLQREAMGKETRFTVNGREVELEYILKCIKRKHIPDDLALLPQEATPYHIIGYTPKSLSNIPDHTAVMATPILEDRGSNRCNRRDIDDELERFRQGVIQLVDHQFATELELRILVLQRLCEEANTADIAAASLSTHPMSAVQRGSKEGIRAEFLDALASTFRKFCAICQSPGRTGEHSSHINGIVLEAMRSDLQDRLHQQGLNVWDPCCADCQSNRTLLNPKHLLLCPNHFRRSAEGLTGTSYTLAPDTSLDILCTLSTSVQEPDAVFLLDHPATKDDSHDWIHLGYEDATCDAKAESVPTDTPQTDAHDLDHGDTATDHWLVDLPDFSQDDNQIPCRAEHLDRHCLICSVTFDTSDKFQMHMRDCHQQDVLSLGRLKDTSWGGHLCFACGITFQNAELLSQHYDVRHPYQGLKFVPIVDVDPAIEMAGLDPDQVRESPWSSRVWDNVKTWTSSKRGSVSSGRDSSDGSLTFSDITNTTTDRSIIRSDDNTLVAAEDISLSMPRSIYSLKEEMTEKMHLGTTPAALTASGNREQLRLSRTMPARRHVPSKRQIAFTLPAGL